MDVGGPARRVKAAPSATLPAFQTQATLPATEHEITCVPAPPLISASNKPSGELSWAKPSSVLV